MLMKYIRLKIPSELLINPSHSLHNRNLYYARSCHVNTIRHQHVLEDSDVKIDFKKLTYLMQNTDIKICKQNFAFEYVFRSIRSGFFRFYLIHLLCLGPRSTRSTIVYHIVYHCIIFPHLFLCLCTFDYVRKR